MGLIKAALGSVGGVLADQWKEYFYCEAMSDDVLMTKGWKKESRRSSNKHGDENIITTGSVVAVADGQCMLIVDQGKIAEVCAEPGEYVYDASTEPTIFEGDLGESLVSVFHNIGRRFTFGGEAPKDQRIYYINTREIVGNKYGTPNPVIFKVVDKDAHFTIDLPVRCFGEYSYRIEDPLTFYQHLGGNVPDEFTRDRLDSQMKSELLTHLQPAFAKISAQGVSYSELMGHTTDIRDALKEELSDEWGNIRGIQIVSFGISSMKGDEEVEKEMREMQREYRYRSDPSLMAARIGSAQAEAMKMAASNTSAGPSMAFMGMNLAGQMGGMNAQNLYNTTSQAAPQPAPQAQPAAEGWTCECGQTGNTGKFCMGCGKPKPAPKDTWTCECGQAGNTGKFCMACGKPRPQKAKGWICKCGALNMGKFCTECGAKKPAGVPQYRCDKCGWEPEDPAHPPKFCPQCGDPFGDEDIK